MQINGTFVSEIYPDNVVGGCINIFYNAWDNPKKDILDVENECSSLENGINWDRAKTFNGGLYQEDRTNYNLGITYLAHNYQNLKMQEIHNKFQYLLLSSSIPYAKKYGIENLYHEYYDMLKYSGGQYYKQHSDGDTVTGRSISAICYLNNDYEGGEIEFVNFRIKIKPEPGMLLLFPSNYAYSHIAHPVVEGTKYAIVTWIKDRYIND